MTATVIDEFTGDTYGGICLEAASRKTGSPSGTQARALSSPELLVPIHRSAWKVISLKSALLLDPLVDELDDLSGRP
jgi:hypothetical protein